MPRISEGREMRMKSMKGGILLALGSGQALDSKVQQLLSKAATFTMRRVGTDLGVNRNILTRHE